MKGPNMNEEERKLRNHMRLDISKGGHSEHIWSTDTHDQIKRQHDDDHQRYVLFLRHKHEETKT